MNPGIRQKRPDPGSDVIHQCQVVHEFASRDIQDAKSERAEDGDAARIVPGSSRASEDLTQSASDEIPVADEVFCEVNRAPSIIYFRAYNPSPVKTILSSVIQVVEVQAQCLPKQLR